MAGNPSNAGIGTGAAQVYDFTGLEDSVANAFNVIAQKKANKESRDRAEKTIQDNLKREMYGDFEYDPLKIRVADVSKFNEVSEKINSFIDNNSDGLINNDPAISNQYRAMLSEAKQLLSTSVDTKKKIETQRKYIQDNPDIFSDEYRQRFNKTYETPLLNYNKLSEEGVFDRDMPRGNFIKNLSDIFPEGNVFYNITKTGGVNADGTGGTVSKKEWKSDEDAYKSFKSGVIQETEMLADINLRYKGEDLSDEEKIRKAYEDYKAATKVYEKSTTYDNQKTKTENDGGGGYLTSTGYRIDVVKLKDGSIKAFPFNPKDKTTKGGKPYMKMVANKNGKKITLEGTLSYVIKKPNGDVYGALTTSKPSWVNLDSKDKAEMFMNTAKKLGINVKSPEDFKNLSDIQKETIKSQVKQEYKSIEKDKVVMYNLTKTPKETLQKLGVENLDELFKTKGNSNTIETTTDPNGKTVYKNPTTGKWQYEKP